MACLLVAAVMPAYWWLQCDGSFRQQRESQMDVLVYGHVSYWSQSIFRD